MSLISGALTSFERLTQRACGNIYLITSILLSNAILPLLAASRLALAASRPAALRHALADQVVQLVKKTVVLGLHLCSGRRCARAGVSRGGAALARLPCFALETGRRTIFQNG